MLSNRNHCIVRMLRFGTPYPHRILGPYFVEDDSQNPLTVNQKRYWEIIIAPSVRDLKRFYHAEICYCDDSGCSKMELVDAARWSYSPHSEGVTCPSATTLWWFLNFPWNGIPVPCTLPRCIHMGHAERIHFPIRWPTWNSSRIMGEDTLIFCVLTTCVHQHVQQSKGPLWTMCETWGYTFWTHAVPMHLDMYCINYRML